MTTEEFGRRLVVIADQIKAIHINAHCIGDAIEAKIDAERAVRRLERDIRASERGREVRSSR